MVTATTCLTGERNYVHDVSLRTAHAGFQTNVGIAATVQLKQVGFHGAICGNRNSSLITLAQFSGNKECLVICGLTSPPVAMAFI